jgi:hypothetical protein
LRAFLFARRAFLLHWRLQKRLADVAFPLLAILHFL